MSGTSHGKEWHSVMMLQNFTPRRYSMPGSRYSGNCIWPEIYLARLWQFLRMSGITRATQIRLVVSVIEASTKDEADIRFHCVFCACHTVL